MKEEVTEVRSGEEESAVLTVFARATTAEEREAVQRLMVVMEKAITRRRYPWSSRGGRVGATARERIKIKCTMLEVDGCRGRSRGR